MRETKLGKIMKKILLSVMVIGLLNTAIAATAPMVDLSGTYLCNGYDSHDGPFKGSKLTLVLNAKNSIPADGYGAYAYSVVTATGTQYTGEASSSGNTLAMYFANATKGQASDHGVAIGSVTYDQNSSGQTQIQLHKFYYEPEYDGGGNGTETCIKQG